MHERENALKEWLVKTIPHDFVLTPLTGDASFRKYYRVQYNGASQIVMDAPPDKETLDPFIHVATRLDEAQIPVPQIIALNKEQGFLLLSDLGDELLLNQLDRNTVDHYYLAAINIILDIQKCSIEDPKLPAFDKQFMLKEMGYCSEWFFDKYLSLQLDEQEILLIKQTMEWIANEVALQPQVFIHRDYHSRNLMLSKDKSISVIDFQDAMRGPVSYDLVSLLKDCYIAWPREKIVFWVSYFHAKSPSLKNYSSAEFIRAFDLCGIQRHLKVLGVFSRLYLRDGKSGYLKDLPLVLKYTLECAETYEELRPFYHFLQKRVRLP